MTTITLSAHALADATKSIVGVTTTKTTLPILNHCLLKVSHGTASVTGSDMELEITAHFEADGESCQVCLPARQLHEAARSIGAGELSISLGENSAKLSAGRSKWTLPTLNAADFPLVEDQRTGEGLSLPLNQLIAAIKGSMYAAAQNDARYYLNGLYLEQRGGLLHVVGTDGHRLACNVLPTDSAFDHIITTSAAKEISRISGERIVIEPHQRGIVWSTDKLRIYAKTIDGRYPDWRRVIPDTAKASPVVIDRKALILALGRVGVIRSGDSREGIRFQFSQGQAALSFANRDGATADDLIECESQIDTAIDLNLGYLNELLANVDAEQLTFHVTDNEKPVLITLGADMPQHILMPMRA